MTLDEMEMDFAKLFDPNEEAAWMAAGSGVAQTTSSNVAAATQGDGRYVAGDGGKLDGEV